MPIPFLTGLGRVLDTAVGPDNWTGVPGWETRTGYTDREGRPRGYDEIYGAVIHTTEWSDAGLSREDAPALAHVTGPVRTRPAHTYNILIARSGHVHLVGAGPEDQPYVGPTFVPERRHVDNLHRDLARFPDAIATPLARGVRALLDRLDENSEGAEAPQAIVPGSLGLAGQWDDETDLPEAEAGA